MPKETPVQRNYGSEIEYSYRFTDPNKSSTGAEVIFREARDIKSIGYFLENGSRLYLDGGLIEYATPECRTLDELITHEFAGEDIVRETFLSEDSQLASIHKRAISPYIMLPPNGYGAHENYTTSMFVKDDNVKDSLAPHFATRTIFIGAGQPTAYGFRIGQKMQDIESPDGDFGREQKALVHTRTNENHAGNSEDLYRLHVVSGDANISPWAVRMKFGTTSVMLRLLEHSVDLHDLFLADSLLSAKQVASGINGIKEPLLLQSGKAYSALDIQEELAIRGGELSQRIELPQEERVIIEEWITTIDALREYSRTGEQQRPLKELDWYTKKQIVDGRREKEEHKKKSELERIKEISQWDLYYDNITEGWGIRLRDKGRFSYNPTDAQKSAAKSIPPEGRAMLRGALIKKTHELGYSAHDASMSWDRFTAPGKDFSRLMDIDADYSKEAIQQRLDTWLPQTY